MTMTTLARSYTDAKLWEGSHGTAEHVRTLRWPQVAVWRIQLPGPEPSYYGLFAAHSLEEDPTSREYAINFTLIRNDHPTLRYSSWVIPRPRPFHLGRIPEKAAIAIASAIAKAVVEGRLPTTPQQAPTEWSALALAAAAAELSMLSK